MKFCKSSASIFLNNVHCQNCLQKNRSLHQKNPQTLNPRTLSFSMVNSWTLLRGRSPHRKFTMTKPPRISWFETAPFSARLRPVNGKILLPVIFLLVFAVSRIPGLMPSNFSAAYAFAFCAGIYFPRRLAWWLPLGVMLATDLGLNFYYQHKFPDENVWSAGNLANLAFNYVAYAALVFLGSRFKPQTPFVTLLGGGIFGAILFYLITNTASWFFNPFNYPEYTKNLAGWIVALTKGARGYPSTWEFFRRTLLSGGLFTALFAGVAKLAAAAESPADKTAGAREPADDGETEAEPEEAKA